MPQAGEPAARIAGMSSENVELVRGVYEGWSRGDFSVATELTASGFEYRQNPEAVEPGTRRGAGIGDALRGIFDVYDDFRVEPSEFIDAGDRVLVVSRALGTAKGSGLDLDMDVFFVWTVTEGKLASNAVFTDRQLALEAAGISDQS